MGYEGSNAILIYYIVHLYSLNFVPRINNLKDSCKIEALKSSEGKILVSIENASWDYITDIS